MMMMMIMLLMCIAAVMVVDASSPSSSHYIHRRRRFQMTTTSTTRRRTTMTTLAFLHPHHPILRKQQQQDNNKSTATTTTSLPSSLTFGTTGGISSKTALFMGMNRKARRQQKKERQGRSRDEKFYDAVLSDESKKGGVAGAATKEKTPPSPTTPTGSRDTDDDDDEETPIHGAKSITDAKVDTQPEVSQVVVDEETGFQRIAQGKAVMDVVTRKPVVLSPLGPDYRMAQFSPGVPPDVREKYRFDNNWENIQVPEIVERLKQACMFPITNETTGETVLSIPPHPSISNEAIDFVLSNRDLLGLRMKKTLGRLKLRYQSMGDVDKAREHRVLWKHYLTIENHISAPFRQMIMNAEETIGPNFGNLDLESFIGKELYERSAAWVVLKGMVAHWEKKYKDALYYTKTEQTNDNFMECLLIGDPKRYLPNPPIIWRLEEITKIAAMAQKMSTTFSNTTSLFNDLPVELRFIDQALSIAGGTELRKFTIQEFCPKENITPEALREGIARLYEQLINMQIDPYGDITNVIGNLARALAVGTNQEYDPYDAYLANMDMDGPGFFETYTFNEDRNSLVRFLDNSRRGTEDGGIDVGSAEDIVGRMGSELTQMFGFDDKKSFDDTSSSSKDRINYGAGMGKDDEYKVPDKRSCGREHELGWLNLLEEDRVEDLNIYESDNWREVNS